MKKTLNIDNIESSSIKAKNVSPSNGVMGINNYEQYFSHFINSLIP